MHYCTALVVTDLQQPAGCINTKRAAERISEDDQVHCRGAVHVAVVGMPNKKRASHFTSPYNEFCKAHRSQLPAGLTNSARERTMGNLWAQLSLEERAAYSGGLIPVPALGRGGFRAWATAQPTTVSHQEPNASHTPSAHPEDQPAAKRSRACQENQCAGVQRAHQQGIETTSRPVQLETMIEGASFATVPERPPKAAELPSFTTASRNKRKYMRAANERKAYQEAMALALVGRTAPLHGVSYRIRESEAAACQLLQHQADPPPPCPWMPPSYGAASPFPVVSRSLSSPLPAAVEPAFPVVSRSLSSPLPAAVEPAVAPHAGEGAGGGPGGGDLSQPGEGSGEGGLSKGELDKILQEQLSRLRSSWYCS